MTTAGRSIAEIPEERREQGVRWLIVEPEPSSEGWLLMGHSSLEEGCEFDGWHRTFDEAVSDAERCWGVPLDAWRLFSLAVPPYA